MIYEIHLSIADAVTLFVINHSLDLDGYNEAIEVFHFDQQTLTLKHKKSISDPNFMKRFVFKGTTVLGMIAS